MSPWTKCALLLVAFPCVGWGCVRLGYDDRSANQRVRDGTVDRTDVALSDHTPAVDLARRDQTPDSVVPSDLETQDLPSVDTSPSPCAPPATLNLQYPIKTMATCTVSDSTQKVNQCVAQKMCNTAGGWHLCTASEFLARGGKVQKTSGVLAWIAACVRSGTTKVHAPTDLACAVCSLQSDKVTAAAWDCIQLAPTFNLGPSYVGVRTSSQCFRVGVNSPATEAHWAPHHSLTPLDGAVCCK